MRSELDQVIARITSDLRKTNLFLQINIKTVFHFEENAKIKFIIEVQENWYLYPNIIFELADRNFNVWWNEYDRSFKRINFGLGAQHVNFSGANDRLKFKFHTGYTNRLELLYYRPAISKTSKFGLKVAFYFSEYKEIAVQTIQNKQVFIKEGNRVLYSSKEFAGGMNYKLNKFWTYDIGINLFRNRFNEDMAKRYPDFLLNGNTDQTYASAFLAAGYYDIDHLLRPTRGFSVSWIAKKTGLGVWDKYKFLSIAQIAKTANKLFHNCYLQTAVLAQVGMDRNKRPYNLYKSLGYSDSNISGYEHYVIDGLDYIYLNNEFRYFIKSFQWNFFKIIKSESKLRIKLDIDLSGQLNAAYVNDPFYSKNNVLVNKFLYSSGAGLNFTLNDVIQFNVIYSINHLKETGFYFHTRKAF
ncbi:MAG: hypothetical protein WAR77_05430 [Saprospiraceae bacterium]